MQLAQSGKDVRIRSITDDKHGNAAQLRTGRPSPHPEGGALIEDDDIRAFAPQLRVDPIEVGANE
jgi:hypothetical protein